MIYLKIDNMETLYRKIEINGKEENLPKKDGVIMFVGKQMNMKDLFLFTE